MFSGKKQNLPMTHLCKPGLIIEKLSFCQCSLPKHGYMNNVTFETHWNTQSL